jgi:hypothetical protein
VSALVLRQGIKELAALAEFAIARSPNLMKEKVATFRKPNALRHRTTGCIHVGILMIWHFSLKRVEVKPHRLLCSVVGTGTTDSRHILYRIDAETFRKGR